MLKRWLLYFRFRKEVDRVALRAQAIAWTKAYFKSRRVANWTNEYQFNFATYVKVYMSVHIHAYAKHRLNEQR